MGWILIGKRANLMKNKLNQWEEIFLRKLLQIKNKQGKIEINCDAHSEMWIVEGHSLDTVFKYLQLTSLNVLFWERNREREQAHSAHWMRVNKKCTE